MDNSAITLDGLMTFDSLHWPFEYLLLMLFPLYLSYVI